MVYSEIDKNSDLLWSARNNSELIRFGGSNGQRTRRNTNCKDDTPAWERETNATFGYGEITRVSLFFKPNNCVIYRAHLLLSFQYFKTLMCISKIIAKRRVWI